MLKTCLVVPLLGVISVVASEAAELSVTEGVRQPKFGFLSGTTSLISSMAQDILSRSTTSSQVLSLNLTNLVILMVLKAIIFGASNLGFGTGSHGRSADAPITENLVHEQESGGFLTEGELLFMLAYMQADYTQKYGCLHRLACENPSKAKEYLLAGKMFLKGSQLISSIDNTKYSNIISGLQEAVAHGLNGQDCSAKYKCNVQSS